jgi:glutamine synthetase
MNFIGQHDLWSNEQKSAVDAALKKIEAEGIEIIRLSWPDQYGLLRGKSLTVSALRSAFQNGSEITLAPFLVDTCSSFFDNPFSKNIFSDTALAGISNMIMVPDPATFKVLPWADRTGWLLADLYLRDGSPFPLTGRNFLRAAAAELADAGYTLNAGLEVEFYLTKIIEPSLDPGTLGGMGVQSTPAVVKVIGKGYSLLLENYLDEADGILSEIRRHLIKLGLPLRSIEKELAPSQYEITFDVMTAVELADAMVLFRNAVKQIARRHGYLASFMCWPGIPDVFPSGWHLHQSLADVKTGNNLFIPAVGEAISPLGKAWAGGILAHAKAASSFTTPTINGYRRRRAYSLAPDRLSWAVDNRAAMIRVIAAPEDAASRIENRIGEPAANPYLYLASQIYAGLDGLKRNTDPGPLQESPYSADVDVLPTSLAGALDAFEASSLYQKAFGDTFARYWIALRRHEWQRFIAAEGEVETNSEKVTVWEHREYFELM